MGLLLHPRMALMSGTIELSRHPFLRKPQFLGRRTPICVCHVRSKPTADLESFSVNRCTRTHVPVLLPQTRLLAMCTHSLGTRMTPWREPATIRRSRELSAETFTVTLLETQIPSADSACSPLSCCWGAATSSAAMLHPQPVAFVNISLTSSWNR